jgi:hypothetical protein
VSKEHQELLTRGHDHLTTDDRDARPRANACHTKRQPIATIKDTGCERTQKVTVCRNAKPISPMWRVAGDSCRLVSPRAMRWLPCIRIRRRGPVRARSQPTRVFADKPHSDNAIHAHLRRRRIKTTASRTTSQQTNYLRRSSMGGRPLAILARTLQAAQHRQACHPQIRNIPRRGHPR